MTVTEKPTDHHADLRRPLDAGYEINFKLPPSGLGYPDAACYWVEMTSPHGSHWRTTGETPDAALRSIWPLSDGPHCGGCGHCDNWGCTHCRIAACRRTGWRLRGRICRRLCRHAPRRAFPM